MSRGIKSDKKYLVIPVELMGEEKVGGVYKIHFGSKYYFGSSINIRERFLRHLRNIRNGEGAKNIRLAYEVCNVMEIEIVYLSSDPINLRKVEEDYIQDNWRDKNLLNEILKTHYEPNTNKKVNQYSPTGVFIKQFPSIFRNL